MPTEVSPPLVLTKNDLNNRASAVPGRQATEQASEKSERTERARSARLRGATEESAKRPKADREKIRR